MLTFFPVKYVALNELKTRNPALLLNNDKHVKFYWLAREKWGENIETWLKFHNWNFFSHFLFRLPSNIDMLLKAKLFSMM